MPITEKDLIAQCIREIEQRYFQEHAAAGKKLRQRDLEYLTDLIEERSGIRISLSTMKRLWKGEFNKAPHPATLDALASLLDHDGWRTYQQTQQHSGGETPVAPQSPVFKKNYGLALIAILLLIVPAGYFFIIEEPKIYVPETVSLEANKTVSLGVPNSVIFEYDLQGVQADSFFIQRSWNPKQKSRIDPNGRHYSEIYYFPGFHWAKLIANEQVIRKKRIHIKTDGWLATAKYDRFDAVPVYLDQEDLVQNGSLSISPENLERSGFERDKNPILSYYNIREFAGTDYDNFVFKTRVKFDDVQGLVCPYLDIKIINEVDASWIGLTPKGCVSNLWLKFGENEMLGTENDLSALGTDLSEWQDLQIRIANKQVDICLNGQTVLRTSYDKDFGGIMGLIFTFTGPGSVDYVRLEGLEGKMLYEDEF